MKTFKPIIPSFKLGFDFICIVLAGIYTFQQIHTYVQNDDYSDISFRKFTDDSSSEYYPTYTICFEDQFQHQIYKKDWIGLNEAKFTGSHDRLPEFDSKTCPCGCDVQKEHNRIFLVNKACPEVEKNPDYFGYDMDMTFWMHGYDNSAQVNLYEPQSYNYSMTSNQGYGDAHYASVFPTSDHGESLYKATGYDATSKQLYGDSHYASGFPSNDHGESLYKDTHYDATSNQGYGDAHYASGFPSYGHEESLYKDSQYDAFDKDLTSQHDVSLPHNSIILSAANNFHIKDNNSTTYDTVFSSDNWSIPLYEYGEGSSEFNEADVKLTTNSDPEQMIIVDLQNKTYIISPEQYKLLMMGYNRTFKVVYDNATNSRIIDSMNLDYKDVDFNYATIGFEDFLLDFEVRVENGSMLGWITDDYEKLQTNCPDYRGVSTGIFKECTAYQDNKKYYQSRITPDYPPFKKQYQDPGKICYTPTLHPSTYRKSERITLDLRKMSDLGTGRESSNEAPFMKIYIHMQGQFMRGIDKQIASLTKGDLAKHCLNKMRYSIFPMPESEFLLWTEKCFGSKLAFDVSQVTLLRSRHDSRKPCNPLMKDEDREIMKALINDKQLKCVPSYWKELPINTDYQECNETHQYRYISDMTANFTNVGEDGIIGKIKHQFDPPCDEMIIVSNKQYLKGKEMVWNDLNGHEDFMTHENETKVRLDIVFTHANPVYQVIKNGRSFSVESCWAGIGGFIGIFVGVSLRQIPELIFDFLKFIKDKLSITS